jgi:hypothetical protein
MAAAIVNTINSNYNKQYQQQLTTATNNYNIKNGTLSTNVLKLYICWAVPNIILSAALQTGYLVLHTTMFVNNVR